ncbi:MAG: iron-containing redox enzyme family protein [Paracoccaceae bacterium]
MNKLIDMSNSQIMRAKMQLTGGTQELAFADFWAREDLPAVAPAFLVLLNQIMRASVPLMIEARDICAKRRSDGPLFVALEEYYAKHVPEETDHDTWTLDDLDAVGFPRDQVLGLTPAPDVAAMVGAQYYWLHHHHPVMLMGYIAILEGSPPPAAHLDWLEEAAGLGKDAWRTYRFHGDVDPHHLQDLNDAIDAMPLTRHEMSLIGISAVHTSNGLAQCVSQLDPSDAPDRVTNE